MHTRIVLTVLSLFLFLCPQAFANADFVLTPDNQSTVKELRPAISVDYPSGIKLNYNGAKLFINDKEVSASCLRTPKFISYQSPIFLTPGVFNVVFQAESQEGQLIERSWSFTIKDNSPIVSLTHNCEKSLGEMEDLIVDMTAAPGGTASFDIENFKFDIPMKEISPGHYKGVYRVMPKDSRRNVNIVARLVLGSNTYTKIADKTVTLWSSLFKVIITEPKDNSQVPLNFKIVGRARPFSKITVIPAIGFSDSLSSPSSADESSQLGTIPGEADANGDFAIPYGFVVKLPKLRAAFTITATDPNGAKSMPTTLHVYFSK